MATYRAVVRDAPVPDARPCAKSADDVRRIVGPDMEELIQEQVRVILLDTRLKVMDVVTVYQGQVDSVAIRQAEIFRAAIIQNAPRIIIVHNHPSGDPTPSPDDRAMTQTAREVGKLLDIELCDHVIVARRGAVSLRQVMSWE